MRRTHTSRLFLALALTGAALASAPLAAQEAQQTHTVKKGDTLWDLAQQYLGDPFRWPEIYRRNTATVQDPNLIYPDQVLIISGDVAPTPGTPPDPSDTTAAARAARAAADSAAARAAAGDTAAMPQQPAYVQKPMTIFNPERFKTVRSTRESLVLRTRESAVRAGDYLRAPFLAGSEGVVGAGKIDATTSADAVGITLSERPIQMNERIYVFLPTGAAGEREERYLVFRYGPDINGEGKVVVPTGVLRISGATANGRAEAVLLTKFEDVYSGQHIMPLDTLADRPGVFPSRVEFGLRTKLLWIYQDPVLPSIGHQVIFAAGAAEGLVAGDQITVQRDMGSDAKGVPLPPEDIAVAQVTRVTPQGTSAVLLNVSDGGLKAGQAARVSAKMP
ncbi:MAG: LysM peptidoglycan-binding domain-containing protein [Gemmatimonadaceae bacterium]